MARSFRRVVFLNRLLPACAFLVALSGCGGESTNRVSGTVTFKGKPVPAGKIYFSPDGSKGNTGGTGYADIKDGKYDTAATGGRGVVNGPSTVAIEGFDPSIPVKANKSEGSSEVTVTSLFPRYETTLEIASTTAKDFDVPAEAATPKRAPAAAPVGVLP